TAAQRSVLVLRLKAVPMDGGSCMARSSVNARGSGLKTGYGGYCASHCTRSRSREYDPVFIRRDTALNPVTSIADAVGNCSPHNCRLHDAMIVWRYTDALIHLLAKRRWGC